MIKVVLNFSKHYQVSQSERKKFKKKKIKIFFHQSKKQFHSSDELFKILNKYSQIHKIVYGDDIIDKKIINLLAKKKCKHIIKWGMGLDSIDLSEAERKKIPVSNFPGIFKKEVAELAIGFVLNFSRKILDIDKNTKKILWKRVLSNSLKNKCVGLIGFGNIGKEIARKLKPFDTKIFYNDLKNTSKKYKRINLKKVFQISDYIIIACDLNKKNYGFINKKILSNSKRKPYLINIARGSLVVEKDIAFALNKKIIAGYATDVFQKEPINVHNKLLKHKNKTIFTNHSASVTYEAVKNINNLITKKILK